MAQCCAGLFFRKKVIDKPEIADTIRVGEVQCQSLNYT